MGLADHAQEEGLFGELPCPSVSRDSLGCPQHPLPAPCSTLRAAGGEEQVGSRCSTQGQPSISVPPWPTCIRVPWGAH